MSFVIDYDLITTRYTQAEAVSFNTPTGADGKPTWQQISIAYPGAACFSSFGRFFENSQGTEPTLEVFARFAASTQSAFQPQFRLCPISYPDGVQELDHSWPVCIKTPATNPQVMWQWVKTNWDTWWANPNHAASGGMFMTFEVRGSGFLYIARLSLVLSR